MHVANLLLFWQINTIDMDIQKTKLGVLILLAGFGAALLGVLGITANGTNGGLVGVIAGGIAGFWLAGIVTKTEE